MTVSYLSQKKFEIAIETKQYFKNIYIYIIYEDTYNIWF